jgi:hypothetical protein
VEPYQQPGQLFNQIAGGYAPIVTGRQHIPRTGMEGVPFMNQPGMVGMGMQMMVAPQMQKMMGGYGMAPMGVGHGQNIADTMRNQQFTQMQQQAMDQMKGQEQQGLMRAFRGMSAVSGTPFGVQQRRAAASLAESGASFAPIMAQMAPDLMDQLGGMRGSPTVMAYRMAQASRYRIDPVTGMMGQSADTVASQAKGMFREMYEGGDIAQMRGISAGQLGGMYDSMTRRGMIQGSGMSLRDETSAALVQMGQDDPANLRRVARDQLGEDFEMPQSMSKLSAEQMDKLRSAPEVSDKLRGFDAERIKRSLKQYVDVVGAMKDIFGELGQPNAPMSQLINGLEALTQGGVGQIDPGRLNMMVRTTSELAQQSGMSLDAGLAMQQHAAGRLQQLGMSPLHAVQAAQGGMAFRAAFNAEGGAATPAWGRYNADQMTQLDTNLRAQAASSEQANRLAVMMRMRTASGGFEEGSTAEAMSNAIMSGQTEFKDPTTGNMRSTNMRGGQFASIMMGAKGVGGSDLGLTEGGLARMMNQRPVNEEFIMRHGIVDQVRRQQTGNTRGFIAARYRESLRNTLEGQGMDKEEANKIASSAALNIANRVGSLSNSEFADNATRKNEIARIMEEEVRQAGGGEVADMAGEGVWGVAADQAFGTVDAGLRRLMGTGYQNIHAVTNERNMAVTQKMQQQARFNAQVKDALQPLGGGSILRRGVQALQDAGPDANFGEILGKAIGGVNTKDIRKNLEAPMQELINAKRRLEDLQQQHTNAPDNASKTRIMREIESQYGIVKGFATKLANIGAEHGIYADENLVTADEASMGVENFRTMMKSVEKMGDMEGQGADKWGEFWKTESGRGFRDQAETAIEDVDNLATGMIMSKQLMRRLGPEALQKFKSLRGSQTRLHELAAQHTGGDISKLIGGDLSSIEDADVRRAVREETHGISDSIFRSQQWFKKSLGAEGAQWGTNDERSARLLLGLPLDEGEALTDGQSKNLRKATRDVKIARQFTAADLKLLESASKGDKKALEALGGRVGEIKGASSVDDMLSGFSAVQKLDKMREKFTAMETSTGSDLVSRLFTDAGLDAEGEYKDTILREAKIGGTGKLLARRLIGTSGYLSDLASKREKEGGDDATSLTGAKIRAGKVGMAAELVDQYFESKEAGTLDDFYSSMGVKSKMEKDEFKRAADRFDYTGMRELDEITNKGKRAERLSEILQTLDRGGDYAKTPQVDPESRELYLKGEVTFHAPNKLDINATGTRGGK